MMEKYDYDLSPTPLQLECERLRKEAEIGKQMLGRMMGEYAELRDQLAEAKRDAARYRWLRYNNNGGMVEVSISDTESGMAWLYKEHDLDAAIDQAMKEGE